MRRIQICIPLLLLQSSIALPSNLSARADSDPCLNQAPTLDGPTSDKSAGIGVEFESTRVTFRKEGCSVKDTNDAKAMQIGDRKDANDLWKLTADTTLNTPGLLSAEYILNGQKIKIGDGVATAQAAAVSSDLVCKATLAKELS